jgi:hypothetical protein
MDYRPLAKHPGIWTRICVSPDVFTVYELRAFWETITKNSALQPTSAFFTIFTSIHHISIAKYFQLP